MQKVKLFKGIETQVNEIEQEINEWIAASGAKIISITGNISPQSTPISSAGDDTGAFRFPPSDILLIVLYEN